MGVRGELFSTRVALQNRTYFFNVKENRLGDLYLNIVESKNREEGGFDRQSVILFAEDLQEFLQGFDESLRVLEKAAREKKRGAPGKREMQRGTSATSGFGTPSRTGEREDYIPAGKRRGQGPRDGKEREGKGRAGFRERQGTFANSASYRAKPRTGNAAGRRDDPRRKGENSGPPREGAPRPARARAKDPQAPPRKRRVVVKKR